MPGGPRKSIHAPPAGKLAAGSAGPPASSAATVAIVGRPFSSRRKRCRTSPGSVVRFAAAATAPASATFSGPPRISCTPGVSVSEVASTVFGARAMASNSAMSSRGRVCSVNWTS